MAKLREVVLVVRVAKVVSRTIDYEPYLPLQVRVLDPLGRLLKGLFCIYFQTEAPAGASHLIRAQELLRSRDDLVIRVELLQNRAFRLKRNHIQVLEERLATLRAS